MWSNLLYMFGFLRLVVPFFVFSFPVSTTLVYIFILDGLDGYIAYRAGWEEKRYFLYDKVLDYWWYGFILFSTARTSIFLVILALFLYRSIGHWLSIITGKPIYLFFFPGIIEIFFLIYILSTRFAAISYFGQNWLVVSLVLATAAGVIREYIVHVKKISIGKLFFGFGPAWKK